MSVSRKENGSLVKKAGRALVDLTLSLTSNHAVANSAVTNQLSANDNMFKAAFQNGKYGFIVDGIFYEIGGGGANMRTRTIRVSGSTGVGVGYFNATISPAIADLSKCFIIPSVRSTAAQGGYSASLVRYTNSVAEFCAPSNGNTGGMSWDGTMQIIEWD